MLDKMLWQEAKQQKVLLMVLAGLGLAGGVLAILQADMLTKIINRVFLDGGSLTAVRPWLGWLLAVMVLRAAGIWFSGIAAYRLAAEIKTAVRRRLVKQLLAIGPVHISGEQTGMLINLLVQGVENLEAYFAKYLPQLFTAALVPLLILVLVFPLDALSAIILLVTAPLIPLFMYLIGRYAAALNNRQWAVLSRMSAHFLDVLQGLTTLKIFGRSKEQLQVIARISDQFRDATLAVLRIAFLSAMVLELLSTISTAIVAVTVGFRLLYGGMTFAEAFFLLLLAPEFYLPLRLLGSQFHAGMAGTAAAADIFRVLHTPVARAAGGDRPLLRQDKVTITFESIYYAYDEGARPALSGVSFSVQAGERVALVGASGAGKSTVANLLLGFIRPDSGIIRINGVPLAEIKLTDWLEHVGFMPQFPYIFHGSVADNIRLGVEGVTFPDVINAAEQAGAHKFIMELPQGYDTIVGEGGRALSGGECQRLAIARVFLKNPPVLILDEATAGLDPETEAAVQAALERLMTGRTVVAIAHRLTTVYKADRIVVLSRGEVAESGRHEDLLVRRGVYYRLVTAFGGVE